jgi:hypothetical protein
MLSKIRASELGASNQHQCSSALMRDNRGEIAGTGIDYVAAIVGVVCQAASR